MPRPLAEEAQLDGAGWGRLWLQIVLPQVRPVAFAAGVLAFATSWNEYLKRETESLTP